MAYIEIPTSGLAAWWQCRDRFQILAKIFAI